MASNSTCPGDFYQKDTEQTSSDSVIITILLAPVLAFIISLVVPAILASILYVYEHKFKRARKAVALTAAGVVTKLALVPDVVDDGEGDKVYFKVYGNGGRARKYEFKIGCAVVFIPLGFALVVAYASVFVTSQWEVTKSCQERSTLNLPMTCYRDVRGCPPLNCTLWNELGRKDNLRCYSFSLNLITPLKTFAGLLSSQVMLLRFFTWVFNKGCCIKPITRFIWMIVGNIGVIIFLVVSVSVISKIPGHDEVAVEVNVTIPLVQLILVTVLETAFVSSLIVMMWMVGQELLKSVTIRMKVSNVIRAGIQLRGRITIVSEDKKLKIHWGNKQRDKMPLVADITLRGDSGSNRLQLVTGMGVHSVEIMTFTLVDNNIEIQTQDGWQQRTLYGTFHELEIKKATKAIFEPDNKKLILSGDELKCGTTGTHETRWDVDPDGLLNSVVGDNGQDRDGEESVDEVNSLIGDNEQDEDGEESVDEPLLSINT